MREESLSEPLGHKCGSDLIHVRMPHKYRTSHAVMSSRVDYATWSRHSCVIVVPVWVVPLGRDQDEALYKIIKL